MGAVIDDIKSRTTDYGNRPAWLKARANGIGSSDAAAICRQSKWATPWSIWAEKKGILEPKQEDIEYKKIGHLMEPVIAKWYYDETKRKVIDLGDYSITKSKEHDWMIATVDRLDIGVTGAGVAEFKTVGGIVASEWRKGVPVYYQIQGQHQLAVTGLQRVTFVVLFGSPAFHFRYYDMDRNEKFIDEMTKREESFWQNNIIDGNEPEISAHRADTESVGRLIANNWRCELPLESLDWDAERQKKLDERKAIQQEIDLLSNRIKSSLGESTEGVVEGTLLYTFKPDAKGNRRLHRVNKEIEELEA